MNMKITYVERQQEQIRTTRIYGEHSHLATIFHKEGAVDLEDYPTDPSEVTARLLAGKGSNKDMLLYAVAGFHCPDGSLLLSGYSSEGFYLCAIAQIDIQLLDPERLLGWDLPRFRAYAEDMSS